MNQVRLVSLPSLKFYPYAKLFISKFFVVSRRNHENGAKTAIFLSVYFPVAFVIFFKENKDLLTFQLSSMFSEKNSEKVIYYNFLIYQP